MSAQARRDTATTHTVVGGCDTCHGRGRTHWTGNATGVAARHHDATGHPTWAEQVLTIHYGGTPPEDPQLPLEGV